MKTYIAKRTADGERKLLVEDEDGSRDLDFARMGSDQLVRDAIARAILRDVFASRAVDPGALAIEHFQAFEKAFLADGRAVVEIEESDIIRWHGARI